MKAGGDLAAAAASPAGLPGRTRDRSRGRCPPGPVTGCPMSEHNLRRDALESPPTRVVLKTGNSHFVGASRVVTLDPANSRAPGAGVETSGETRQVSAAPLGVVAAGSIAVPDVLARLDSGRAGLTAAEAA